VNKVNVGFKKNILTSGDSDYDSDPAMLSSLLLGQAFALWNYSFYLHNKVKMDGLSAEDKLELGIDLCKDIISLNKEIYYKKGMSKLWE